MKSAVWLAITVFLMGLLPLSASAFSYSDLSESEMHTVQENLQIAVMESFPPTGAEPFSCFDVSSSGKIALKMGGGETKEILVLNENGDFLYGFAVQTAGEVAVGWENDNVVIYFVRSDLAVAVNEQGDILSIQEIENTIENNTYWNQTVYAQKRVCGESTYVMGDSNPLLNIFSGTSILQKIDANGNKTVLYDASHALYQGIVLQTIATVFLVVFGIFIVISAPKHRIREQQYD